MRKTLFAVLVALLVGCTQNNPTVFEQSLTAVRLDMDDGGTCSGTVVGPSVILTAKHCLIEDLPVLKISTEDQGPPSPKKKPEPKKKPDPKVSPFDLLELLTPPGPPTSMSINGRETKIISIVPDQNDHILVEVAYTFSHCATLGVNRPDVGQRIHYWGNPARKNTVYREGYVSFYDKAMMEMDVNGFFGDSGAGIFNADGKVVGVMNVIDYNHHHGLQFTMMGSDPLNFTPQQLDMMGIR